MARLLLFYARLVLRCTKKSPAVGCRAVRIEDVAVNEECGAGEQEASAYEMQVRLNMPLGITIILIDGDDGRRGMMDDLLIEGGYKVAARLEDPAALADACRRYRPDAVVVSTARPTKRLLKAIEDHQERGPRPVVMFSEDDGSASVQAAIAAGVNAYIVVGLSANRIRSAVDLAFANFNQTECLRNRAREAEEALRDRKVIERAKGILMKQRNIGEDEAYRLLRTRAMERSVRLVEVARMITDAAEMLVDTAS